MIEFEEFVRPELSQNMPAKKISLAEDETFHPQICAVSMEPVSNFIFLNIPKMISKHLKRQPKNVPGYFRDPVRA